MLYMNKNMCYITKVVYNMSNVLHNMLYSCFENQSITKHNLLNVLHNMLFMMVYIH